MELNIWEIGFLTGLILSLSTVDKAVTIQLKSVDILAQYQDIYTSAKLTPVQVKKLVNLDKKKIEIGGKGGITTDKFKVIPTFISPGFKVS
ncbi:MAG: hypothetical protein F6K24_04830 [Okeania sp. SIO2D1]|nr:hypothetical protein [Okeania sp. SIO2D1]